MNSLIRILKHLIATRWQVSRCLPQHSLQNITTAIRDSEVLHMGELRFAVEAGLEWPALFTGLTSRQRAVQVFSDLGVWDTQHNSGVLIYLLLADRKVEIVADRGISALVSDAEWISICQDMEALFRADQFETGVLGGVTAITELLKHHFPAEQSNPNDLSDKPAIL